MSDTVPKWASSKFSAELPNIREIGETDTIEFKRTFPEQAHDLAKEIAAMASSGGGYIYIGIDDDGKLFGLEAATGSERDKIQDRTHGSSLKVKPIPKVECFFAVESKQTVLVVEVPKQDHPIFYHEWRPYVRDKRRARPAEPEEVIELIWAHPSSEFKKEMERITLQTMRDANDNNRQLARMAADQVSDNMLPLGHTTRQSRD